MTDPQEAELKSSAELAVIAADLRKHGRLPQAYACALAATMRPDPGPPAFEELAVSARLMGHIDQAKATYWHLLSSPGLSLAVFMRAKRGQAACYPETTPAQPLVPCPARYGAPATVTIATRGTPSGGVHRAVKSILGQTYHNVRCVVVSDGDDEPPWAELEEWADDPRLVTYRLPRQHGQFFIHEVTLRATPDQLFAVQDASDTSPRKRIENLTRRMLDSGADVVFCDIEKTGPQGGTLRVASSLGAVFDDRAKRLFSVGPHMGLMKSEALRKIGGYYAGADVRLGYDTYIVNLLATLGRASHLPAVLYRQQLEATSMTISSETGLGSEARAKSVAALRAMFQRVTDSADPVLEAARVGREARGSEERDVRTHAQALHREIYAKCARVADLPGLTGPSFAAARTELAPIHAAYCRDVSSAMHAASLELISLLRCLAVPGPRLDLGSGISSLGLSTPDHPITTVDTDADWLAKTRSFLESIDDAADRTLRSWDSFVRSPGGPYSLILQDIGGMQRRADSLQFVWDLLAPGGFMVLDDLHKTGYRMSVRAFLQSIPHRFHDVRLLTTDEFGRYAYVIGKPK